MSPLESLIDQTDAKVEQIKEFMASGRAQSFEDYQKMCGEIRGLLTARSYAQDLQSNLENMDE
jgi:hypothetical protein